MKILIANDGQTAHYHIRLGLARAFGACGHDTIFWDINKKPANDAFDESEPDILMFQTYNVNRIIKQAIKERPHLKVAMKASDWSNFSNSIDKEKYPILCSSKKEQETIIDLLEETGKPDYLYVHHHPLWIEQTHENWIKAGFKVYDQLNAADIFEYSTGTVRPEFVSDITFVGGYWPYKAKTFDKYLIPICKLNEHRIKIFGNSVWPVHQYCGSLDNSLVKDALRSAKICPSLHEPHGQDFGYDINERPFKLLSNKCFVVSDYVEGLVQIFNQDEMVFCRNPSDFKDSIYHFIKYPDERLPYIIRGFKKVINEHTYFHRVIDIFNRLNLPEQADKAIETYDTLKEKIRI